MDRKENVKRIVSLVAGVIVLLGMGSLYSFSGYSTVLKARMNYTETELNTVSAIGDMGLYIGALPVGFMYDRFGPRITFIGAIALIWLGYFLMYQATSLNIAGSAVLMGIYFFFAGAGSIFGFNGAVVTNIKNFPMQHKGKISGALYGGFGLSAALVTQMFKMFFYDSTTAEYNIEGFFLTLSFLLSGLAIVGLAFVQKVNQSSGETKPLLGQDETGDKIEPPVEKKEHVGIYGAFGLSRLWRHSAFIVLFFAFILAAGSGLTFINILGGVIKSWKITELDSTKFVIILSLSNFAGRVLTGNLIDVLQKIMPAGAVLIFPAALMAVSHTLLALFPTFAVLLVGTVGSTVAYGAFWAGFNYLLSAYFGDKYLGQNLGAIALGAGGSSLILNVIAGRIYDSQTSPGEGESHQCYGEMCYRYTFFITAAMSIAATVLVVGMSIQEGRRKKYLRVN
jgi:MFS family permease